MVFTWAPCCSTGCSDCNRGEPSPSAGSPCSGWRWRRGRWRRGGSASRWKPSRGCSPQTPRAPPSNQGRGGSSWPQFQPWRKEAREQINCDQPDRAAWPLVHLLRQVQLPPSQGESPRGGQKLVSGCLLAMERHLLLVLTPYSYKSHLIIGVGEVSVNLHWVGLPLLTHLKCQHFCQ